MVLGLRVWIVQFITKTFYPPDLATRESYPTIDPRTVEDRKDLKFVGKDLLACCLIAEVRV
jgi:hypothetical protein